VIFIFLWTRATKDKFLLAALLRIGAFGLASVGTKFGVGYLIAGPKALSIFGSYGDLGSAGEVATTTITQNAGFDVIGTGWGQTLMITMVLGVALPVAILGFLELFKKDNLVAEANRLRAVVGISLLNMMAVVAVFEAWQNLNTWMHTRYYSYLIPLAVVVLVEAYSRASTELRPIPKKIVVGIFLVLASVALFTAAIPYGANWIDAPDFKFHIDNLVFSSILIIISIALAIWWLWDVKKSTLFALMVALVASTLSGTHISNFLTANFGQDTVHDQLGVFMRSHIPQSQLDKTVLVGENMTTLERALFASLSGGARALVPPPTGLSAQELPGDTVWLIKVGEPVVNGLPEQFLNANGYSVFPLNDQAKLSFENSSLSSITNPCSLPENTEWSCGSSAKISEVARYPKAAVVDLIIDVSEPTAGQELNFILGDSVLVGTLTSGIYALTLAFSNSSEENFLEIKTSGQASIGNNQAEQRFIRVLSINTKR
jgi:hypothetical protein